MTQQQLLREGDNSNCWRQLEHYFLHAHTYCSVYKKWYLCNLQNKLQYKNYKVLPYPHISKENHMNTHLKSTSELPTPYTSIYATQVCEKIKERTFTNPLKFQFLLPHPHYHNIWSFNFLIWCLHADSSPLNNNFLFFTNEQ